MSISKKVAIVQPYIFPYIGYFQLINSVDSFVFYDDVNFIKRGWINRNRVLFDGSDKLISIPLIKSSQNKLINEIEVNYGKEYDNVLTLIKAVYKKAPYYKDCIQLIEDVLSSRTYDSVASLAAISVQKTQLFLGIEKDFKVSSQDFPETRGLERATRLIEITKLLNGKTYINPIGGKLLYEKGHFEKSSLKLQFIEPIYSEYKQFGSSFVQGLSIIDILMFNSKAKVIQMLNNYRLV